MYFNKIKLAYIVDEAPNVRCIIHNFQFFNHTTIKLSAHVFSGVHAWASNISAWRSSEISQPGYYKQQEVL